MDGVTDATFASEESVQSFIDMLDNAHENSEKPQLAGKVTRGQKRKADGELEDDEDDGVGSHGGEILETLRAILTELREHNRMVNILLPSASARSVTQPREGQRHSVSDVRKSTKRGRK